MPAADKIVIPFEPYTDIVRKGGRDTIYGHKIKPDHRAQRTAARRGGGDRQSTRQYTLPSQARAISVALLGGTVPRRRWRRLCVARQPRAGQAAGVEHSVFHKKSGLKPMDITPFSWLPDQLKRFGAGIEAGISYLKRCFGLARCRWRGLGGFKAYAHSSIFTHDLLRLAGPQPQPT